MPLEPRRIRRQRRGERYTPRLWPVPAAVLTALILAAVIAWLMYLGVRAISEPGVGAPQTSPSAMPTAPSATETPIPTAGPPSPAPTTQTSPDQAAASSTPSVEAARNTKLELIKTTLAVMAFWGAILTGVYAYRKQRLAEGEAKRLDERHFLDRYAAAAEQLGEESTTTRIAGAYAMGALADDWYSHRQMCADVLCAYVRAPYETNPGSAKYREGDREVRRVILRIIRDNLRRPEPERRWRGLVLSFEGAVFDYGDLSGAHFEDGYVSFHRAEFIGRTFLLSDTDFLRTGVSFSGAKFNGAHVSFNKANMRLARSVDFKDADFRTGSVSFKEADIGAADFSGAIIQNAAVVEFSATKHSSGAKLGPFGGTPGLMADW